MMSCDNVRRWLRGDLDGAAEPSSEVAAHLGRCEACAAEARRLQAISAAARAALPRAAVPVDFVDGVMGSLVEAPVRDLTDAVRPRWRRRLLFFPTLVALPLLIAVFWPRPEVRPAVEVERYARVDAEGLRYTAMAPLLMREGPPVELVAGSAIFQCDRPATVRTALADVRLAAGAECLIRVTDKKETMEMDLKQLKRIVPAFLAVTVMSGSVRVANAQGEEEAGRDEVVEVVPGKAPRLDEEAVVRELEVIAKVLDDLNRRMELLQRQIRGQGRAPKAKQVVEVEEVVEEPVEPKEPVDARRELERQLERLATLKERRARGEPVEDAEIENLRRVIEVTTEILAGRDRVRAADDARTQAVRVAELTMQNAELRQRIALLERELARGAAKDKAAESSDPGMLRDERMLRDLKDKRLAQRLAELERLLALKNAQGEKLRMGGLEERRKLEHLVQLAENYEQRLAQTEVQLREDPESKELRAERAKLTMNLKALRSEIDAAERRLVRGPDPVREERKSLATRTILEHAWRVRKLEVALKEALEADREKEARQLRAELEQARGLVGLAYELLDVERAIDLRALKGERDAELERKRRELEARIAAEQEPARRR